LHLSFIVVRKRKCLNVVLPGLPPLSTFFWSSSCLVAPFWTMSADIFWPIPFRILPRISPFRPPLVFLLYPGVCSFLRPFSRLRQLPFSLRGVLVPKPASSDGVAFGVFLLFSSLQVFSSPSSQIYAQADRLPPNRTAMVGRLMFRPFLDGFFLPHQAATYNWLCRIFFRFHVAAFAGSPTTVSHENSPHAIQLLLLL